MVTSHCKNARKFMKASLDPCQETYDRVQKEEIWKRTRECNVPEKYVKPVNRYRTMHRGCKTKVRELQNAKTTAPTWTWATPGICLEPITCSSYACNGVARIFVWGGHPVHFPSSLREPTAFSGWGGGSSRHLSC